MKPQATPTATEDNLPNCSKECSATRIIEAGELVIEALKQLRTNKAFLNNISVMLRKSSGYYDTDTSITY